MRNIKLDIVIGAFLALFSAVTFFMSADMPAGAGQFPKLLSGTLFLMSVAILSLVLVGLTRGGTAAPKSETEGEGHEKSAIITFVCICLYVVAVDYLGFFTSTLFFVSMMMAYFGNRKLISILMTVSLLCLFIYILFDVQLGIQLPAGDYY